MKVKKNKGGKRKNRDKKARGIQKKEALFGTEDEGVENLYKRDTQIVG